MYKITIAKAEEETEKNYRAWNAVYEQEMEEVNIIAVIKAVNSLT